MGKNAKQVTCKRDCERDLRAAMPRAASSVGVGRRVHVFMFACFLVLRSFPRIFEEKRDCSQSSGIDETSNVVQLNGFFGKRFYFYNLFSQSASSPVYLFNLCLYLSISYQSTFFYLTISQR